MTVTPEDLVEIEAIKRLKYRYVRLLDTKEFDEMEELFLEDATASYGDGAYSFEGREKILEFLRSALGPRTMVTSHKVHQPEIDLTGPGRASGTWGLEDVVIITDHALEIRGAAFYADEYVKVDDAWRIKHTGYQRLFEEMGSRPADLKLTANRWADGA
ncbi:MAG: hypothetical protein QOE35_379 [Actinomycetota bacterium]|jgi:hypothetical protein